ncbi:MAG: efflux RND transporter periplasmic adaptor subunit [bacterium]|nr:efflux RND transporter periplasmic adaptor subunit [bacterium]
MDFKNLIKNKPFYFILAIVFITVTLLAVFFKESPAGKEIPLVPARLQPFGIDIDAVGQLDSVNAVTVSSELKEEVKIIYLVDDGARVKKNDILVKFGTKKFEEAFFALSAKVKEWQSLVNARKQLLEWEKNQSKREIETAGFDFKVAKLEQQKLEKGDGPLELSRLEGELLEKKSKCDDLKAYIKDLKTLTAKGYQYPAELSQSEKKLARALKEHKVAVQKYDSYKNFYLPTAIETAKARAQRAKMIIDRTRKGTGFKVGKALAECKKSLQELEDYKRQLSEAQTAMDKTTVRSPQTGLVVLKESYLKGDFRKPRVGDVVIKNQPIMFLPDISAMKVKVLIREVDLNKLRIGKRVEVSVDAYPELELTGKLSFIGALAEQRREVKGGEKYFKVDISVNENEELLRPGMTARVRIIVREEGKERLLLPIHAIFHEEGRNYVYVAGTGDFLRREVKLGLQNFEQVEILSGVLKGERVALVKPVSY